MTIAVSYNTRWDTIPTIVSGTPGVSLPRGRGRSRATCNGDLLMLETLLKSFDTPDDVREFPFGRFEIIHLGDVARGEPPISRDGSGRFTTHQSRERRSAMRRIPARCYPATARSGMRTAPISIYCRALPSTLRQARTTVGSSGTCRTYHCMC